MDILITLVGLLLIGTGLLYILSWRDDPNFKQNMDDYERNYDSWYAGTGIENRD